jgi:ribosomal protein S16
MHFGIMNRKFKIGAIICLLASISSSCLYEKTPVNPTVDMPITNDPNSNPTDLPANIPLSVCKPSASSNTKDSVCFNTQILPLFVTNCAQSGCHDAITRAEGYDLTTFLKITSKGIDRKSPKNSKIYTEMLGNMPPKPLTKLLKSQTDLVLKWISEGAKNVNCSSAIDTTNITFSKTIFPLLQTNCVGCHQTGLASGGVLLNSYDNISTYIANKRIWGAINYVSGYVAMPPTEKMTDCQLAIIKKWIDNGAKND